MKKLIALLMLSQVNLCTSAQQNRYSFEVQPFLRYDKAKEFLSWTTPIGGNNYVTPRGISSGININAFKQISKNINIFFGIGYLNFRVSNIQTRNRRGSTDNRLINYPSPLLIPFFSNRYSYHTFSLNLGLERKFTLRSKYLITTGIGISGLNTFSQKYHLTTNPEGSQTYKKNNSDVFGLLAGLDIGILRNIKKLAIGPKLKLPVFTSIKTDATFPNETGTNFRDQWSNAIGLGMSFIYKF